MNLTQTFNYSNSADFTFDATKLVFFSGSAKLKLLTNPGQNFIANVASSTGYTFDAAKIEFSAGAIKQLLQTPVAAILNAAPDVTISGNMVTKTGGATVGTTSTQEIPSGDGYVNFSSTTVGDWTAGLSSQASPYAAANVEYGFRVNGAGTVSVRESGVTITTAGTWLITDVYQVAIENGVVVYRKNGTLIYTSANPPTYPQHFIASITATGAQLNNIFILTTSNYVGSLTTFPAFVYPGAFSLLSFTGAAITDANAPHYTLNGLYWNGSSWIASDESYAQGNTAATLIAQIASLPAANSVIVRMITQNSLSTQMQISALTLTYTGQIYSTTNPAITTVTGNFNTDALVSFVASLSASGSDAIRFQIVVNGTPTYWNSPAWVTSDSSYAQSNDAATLNSQLPQLAFAANALISLRALLHSATGATTPTITSTAFTYVVHQAIPTPTPPALCHVFVFLEDILGAPLSASINNAVLHSVPENSYFSGQWLVALTTRSADFDSVGYTELDLVESATPGVNYVFSLTYNDGTLPRIIRFEPVPVPNAASANLSTFAVIASG